MLDQLFSRRHAAAFVKCKLKLDAECKKTKGLVKKNKELVQDLAAAKAKINELEQAASRQQKIERLYLLVIKSTLDAQEGTLRALLKNCRQSVELLRNVLTPKPDLILAAEASLQEEAAALRT